MLCVSPGDSKCCAEDTSKVLEVPCPLWNRGSQTLQGSAEGCSPLSWDMLNRPCCFLSVSRSPPAPPGSPARPRVAGLGSAVLHGRCLLLILHRAGALRSCRHCAWSRTDYGSLLDAEEHVCLCFSTCLCIFLLKFVVQFHLLFVNLKNWRKWFWR